ncbi:prephenate dehydrogenase [Laceyella putida]|uniref:Prephenate dehydrogenase n=1 Tax=Laceyella putida TaxID=110101 RepID=A0ABW2RMX0_9BACL
MPDRIAVLGIGLIGGSIALGLKERTDVEVIGYDRSSEDLGLAAALGAIDKGTVDLAEAVSEADIIIIALPVGAIKETIDRLAELPLKEACIVTDVGSTKSEIVAHSKKLKQKGTIFIGGHPMAGSHRSGIKAAHSLLFENAYYVLTPDPDTSLLAVQKLSRLLHLATRAELIIMNPIHHDRVVGAISHLPHIIAAGLVNMVGDYNEQNEWFHRLAAGGFRSLTRIGASHPIMWRDILLSNQEELIKLLDDWMLQMLKMRTAIYKQDANQIEAFFARSKQLRGQLPDREKGLLMPLYECYLDIPDQPGEIARVTAILSENDVNISNIEVLNNREELPGVLKLTYKKEQDYQQAVVCLKAAGYTVFTDHDSADPSETKVKSKLMS